MIYLLICIVLVFLSTSALTLPIFAAGKIEVGSPRMDTVYKDPGNDSPLKDTLKHILVVVSDITQEISF
jgi:hypothetical protein